MIHNRVNDKGDHWAVNHNGYGTVLVQLQEVYSKGNCEQVRIMLTPEQAIEFATQMLVKASIAKSQKSLKEVKEEVNKETPHLY